MSNMSNKLDMSNVLNVGLIFLLDTSLPNVFSSFLSFINIHEYKNEIII